MELPLWGSFNATCALSGEVENHQTLLWGKVLAWRGQQAQVGESEPRKNWILEVSETSYCPESLPDSHTDPATGLPGQDCADGVSQSPLRAEGIAALPHSTQSPHGDLHVPSPTSCSLVFQTNPLYLLH